MKNAYLQAVLEGLEDKPGGWVGFDLDGTLAHYDKWRGIEHIGKPIASMVARVKKYIEDGIEVRIFTARVAQDTPEASEEAIRYIQEWTQRYIGLVLKVTNEKDSLMIRCYDDRAVGVIENKGAIIVAPSTEPQVSA